VRVFSPSGQLIVELGILGDCWGHGLMSSQFAGRDDGYTITDTSGFMFDKPPAADHIRREGDPDWDLPDFCDCCYQDWPCAEAPPWTPVALPVVP